MSLTMEEIDVDGYEKVIAVTDKESGLKGIISIHNTTMGPALGGIRIYPYNTFDDALTDVLRLSRGMTYKSVIAQAGLGGGKSVIIADPKSQKTPELLRAFGKAVEALQGSYICAEDVGCSTSDVMTIREVTKYVVGLPHEKSSGDPGPFTAFGTYRGIQAVLKTLDGSDSLQGKKIAIQGLGSVGSALCEILFWAGADLIVSDIDEKKTQMIAKKYGAKAVSPQDILFEECDVLSPCAMGGILSSLSIPKLRCRAIAGSANNQLLSDADANLLHSKGILYAPDFVINAGGLINVLIELELVGYNPLVSRKKVNAIYDELMAIFEISKRENCSTNTAALSLGDHRLASGFGKRQQPVCFHTDTKTK